MYSYVLYCNIDKSGFNAVSASLVQFSFQKKELKKSMVCLTDDIHITLPFTIKLHQSCWFIIISYEENAIDCIIFLSSPEPKAQVSFSDQNLSASVVVVVVVAVVNFSYFHVLLQNHWVNFNQTWRIASLGEGDSSLFKWRAPPFSKGRSIV